MFGSSLESAKMIRNNGYDSVISVLSVSAQKMGLVCINCSTIHEVPVWS